LLPNTTDLDDDSAPVTDTDADTTEQEERKEGDTTEASTN